MDKTQPAEKRVNKAAERYKDQWFRGVIQAQCSRGKGLQAQEVTYTIATRKIRREIVASGVFDKAFGTVFRAQIVSGVVCNLDSGEAVLYCDKWGDKNLVRLSMQDYRKFIAQLSFDNSLGSSDWD